MIGMLRKSILYNQTLTMNCVASTFNEYKKRSNDIDKWFAEKGYKENTQTKSKNYATYRDQFF